MRCIACGKNKMNLEPLCLDCKIIMDLINIKYFNNSYKNYNISLDNQHNYNTRIKRMVG